MKTLPGALRRLAKKLLLVIAFLVFAWVPILIGFAVGVQIVAGGFDPETVELLLFLAWEGIWLTLGI